MQRIKHLKVISAAAIAILLFSSVTATAAEVQELPGDGESDLMEEVDETEELTIPAGVWSDQEPVFSDDGTDEAAGLSLQMMVRKNRLVSLFRWQEPQEPVQPTRKLMRP